jgi:hypothetical protein
MSCNWTLSNSIRGLEERFRWRTPVRPAVLLLAVFPVVDGWLVAGLLVAGCDDVGCAVEISSSI